MSSSYFGRTAARVRRLLTHVNRLADMIHVLRNYVKVSSVIERFPSEVNYSKLMSVAGGFLRELGSKVGLRC